MKVKRIESASNPLYKKLASLTKSDGVEEHGQCLVSGSKILSELVKNPPNGCFWIYTQEEHALFQEQPGLQLILMPKTLYKFLNPIGAPGPLLCVPVPMLPGWDANTEPQSHELLCALGDPNNLGALLRSAKAFGVDTVVLLDEACHPFHPKAIKASAGACFHLNLMRGPSIQNLQNVKQLLALDKDGTAISKMDLKKPRRLLLGEEGKGLPADLKTEKVAIPINDSIESLNATVAASILLYEISRA